MIIGRIKNPDGLYFKLPCKPISINEYKKMHWAVVKKIKGEYKSMIDMLIVDAINCKYKIGPDGIFIDDRLFPNKVDVEWVLSFGKVNQRDPSNYTQKILLDAVVMSGLLVDDSSKYVNSDKTILSPNKEECIWCILKGKINKEMVMSDIKITKYQDVLNLAGVE